MERAERCELLNEGILNYWRTHWRQLALVIISFSVLSVWFGAVSTLAAKSAKRSANQTNEPAAASRDFSEVVISPDSRYVAWVSGLQIFVKDLTEVSIKPQKIAQGSDLAWSPDSRRLAFLSRIGSETQQQLYVTDAGGGTIRRFTNLKGDLSNPRWSPDGKTLAFLFIDNPLRRPGPGSPIPPPVGVVGNRNPFEQRVAMLNVVSRQVRFISPPDLYVYEYDWSPDSRQVIATAAHGAGDNNWYIAQLYIIKADSGQLESILKSDMQITAPRWSPDGKQIAFIGGIMSGSLGGNSGDVYLIPAKGDRARNLTAQMKASAHDLVWLSTNRLLIREYVDGQIGLAEVDTKGGIKPLWVGTTFSAQGAWMPVISVARDGMTSAVLLGSLDRPTEVWQGAIGSWRQITHVNQDFHPVFEKVESIHWKSDKWQIQGWITYPRGYNSHRRYPMVVEVHGGPSGMASAGCGRQFAAEGYFALCPNYRGSAGFGEEFQKANFRDFGYGDLRDILAGVDRVVETLPIDMNRIGITGQSYGGYMAMWAVTQTGLFHAAVANAGIVDWLSYVAQADIPQWVMPYFGVLIYADPAIYARSSPMNYIMKVKAPTLIVVGAGDGECPAAQSLEFWYALKTLGVETQLVIYPNEGHEMTDPKDIRDVNQREMEWFNKYLR